MPPSIRRQKSAQTGTPIRKPPGRRGDRAPTVRNPRRRAVSPQSLPANPAAGSQTSGIRAAGQSHPKTSLQTRRPRPSRQESAPQPARSRHSSREPRHPALFSRQRGPEAPPHDRKPRAKPAAVRNPRRQAIPSESLPADQAAGSQTSGIRADGQPHPKTSRQAGRPDPSRQEFAPKSPSREKPPSKASSRSQPATRPTGIPRPTHRLLAAECRTLSAIPPNNQVQIHAQIESSSRDSRAPRCAIHAAAL